MKKTILMAAIFFGLSLAAIAQNDFKLKNGTNYKADGMFLGELNNHNFFLDVQNDNLIFTDVSFLGYDEYRQFNNISIDEIPLVSIRDENGIYPPEPSTFYEKGFASLIFFKQPTATNWKYMSTTDGSVAKQEKGIAQAYYQFYSNKQETIYKAIAFLKSKGLKTSIVIPEVKEPKEESNTTSTKSSSSSKSSKKDEVKEIKVELQNTSKEAIFLKYDGGVNGSTTIGAGMVTSFRCKLGAKISNKRTGIVYLVVDESTKPNSRVKIQ